MRRPGFLLLLLLVWQPGLPALAGQDGPGGGAALRAIGDRADLVAWPGAGLELLRALDRRRPPAPDASRPVGSGPGSRGSATVWAREPASPAILPPRVRVHPPLCERLTYHATAPPAAP